VPITRSRSLLAVVGASALLAPLISVTAAHAADPPGAVGPGSLYLEDFADGLADWTALTGTMSEWSATDGTVSIDTRGQSSGRYIRPTSALSLPDAYELRTHVRVDAVEATGTVTLMLDMRDLTNWKSTGISPQFTGFDTADNGRFQISQPVAGAHVCQGLAPVEPGEWAEVVVRRAIGITAVYVGDELVGSAVSPTAGGTIGLGSYKSKVAFGAVSIDPLTSTPADHPSTAQGCSWVAPVAPPEEPDPAPGTGEVSGAGDWVPVTATTRDRPGHEITDGRSTISLNGAWKFIAEDLEEPRDGVAEGWFEPGADASDWDTLQVPGNWSVHDQYGRYEGNGWYRRTFESGDLSAAAGERARLEFGAVYNTATVWLNGAKLGSHTGGYTPFEFDVTDYLIDGENTLVVRADNTFQQGAWWSWGGISRSVELVKTGEVTIDRQQIVAKPDLAAGTAHIDSTVFLENAGDQTRTVTLSGAITDAATGAVLVDGLAAQVDVPAGGTAQSVLSADLVAGSFELWNMDDPNLYRLDLSLDSPTDVDDAAQSDRFGIREFRIDGTKMLLNGEPLKSAGGNRVSDDPINGNVEPTWVVRRDLDRMKASGMNITRIMHYAQAPELLDYADEIGMLLIDEVPVWGTSRVAEMHGDPVQIKQEFREMVERDFNHASIFAHSVANEIESNLPYGKEFLRVMADYSHEIDPSRFVTHANNKVERAETKSREQDGSIFMDFVSINLYGNYAGGPDKMHDYYDKPMFISEYSPDGFTFPIDREWLDFSTGADTTASHFKSRDFVFGWSQWTYNDYRSEHTGSSANLVRGWGNADVWGRLKAAYDETQASNAPVKAFTLADVAVAAGGGLGVVSITPSGPVPSDGPSHVLRGYRVTLQAFDASGDVVGGTMVDLPDITPGDAAFDVPVAWSAGAAATRVRATLLSPTGYEVSVSTTDAAKPAAPEIREVRTADGTIRVAFDDEAGIGRYRATATAPDGTRTSVTTRERFADLTGLANGTEYVVAVAAVGSSGAGASDEATATPGGSLTAPPKVLNVEAIEGGAVLGYSSPTFGGWYQVKVTDAATEAELVTYTTQNRPGTRIEGLEPGTPVDVRIREVADQDASSATSEWSEALRTTPLSPDDAPELEVHGLIGGANAAGIVLSPSNRTERYHVTVQGEGVDSAFTLERSGIDLIPLEGLSPQRDYTVTITAEGAGGTTEAWSGSVRTRAETPTGDPTVPTGVRVTNRGNDAFLVWDDSGADGYVVTGDRCDATTSTTVIGSELALGKIGQNPGSYTVAAVLGRSVSDASAAVTAPGEERCPLIVSTADKAPRADGSVPFTTSSGWLSSGITGAGSHPSMYAEIPKTAGASATWTAPAVDGEVTYRIEASLPASSTSTKDATYVVSSVDGDTVIPVDQAALGGTWVDLGEFTFDAEHRPTIVLTGKDGFLRASAMRFTDTSVAGLPDAPEPSFAAQEISPEDPITGTGTAAGNTVVVTAADGTVLGRGTVGDDLTWEAEGSVAFTPGVYADAVVTETDGDGWIGTATATVTVAAPAAELEVIASATSRCVGSKVLLSLTARNEEDVPVDVELSTPYGAKSFADIAPGKSAFHTFTTRLKDLPAGEATITASAEVNGAPTSSIVTVPFEARSCG
jgi:beta-galactosidase